MNDLIGSWWRAFIAGLITLLIALASYKILELFKRDAADEALLPLLTGPATLAAVGLIGLLVNWSTIIPYREWIEAEKISGEMKSKLLPRMAVLSTGEIQPKQAGYGITQRSLTGSKQTILRADPPFYCIDVQNQSEASLTNCAPYIEGFRAVGGQQIPEWQTIPLPWLPIASDKIDKVDLSPSATRSFFLLGVVQNRVSFVSDLMPVAMVNIIQDEGEYEGTIVVTAENSGPKKVPFNLKCNGPDNPPRLTVFAKDD